MNVLRIVTNVATDRAADAQRFYGEFLGLQCAMDVGWIVTFIANTDAKPQISFAIEGGAGTKVPDISVGVDDLDEAVKRAKRLGYPIEYGPVTESWGVRRFYTRDPFGRLVNILSHARESFASDRTRSINSARRRAAPGARVRPYGRTRGLGLLSHGRSFLA